MKLDFDYVRRAGRNIRIHGNGFIQIDLLDRPDQRIHVFGHPDILRQSSPTPVHDHRFGFVSKILSGCLVNVDWQACDPAKGQPATHMVCTYEAPEPGSEDTKLVVHTDRLLALRKVGAAVHVAGGEYTVHAGRFHETFANEATITHMTKTHTLAAFQPRVLCRVGQQPDNGFNRYEMVSLPKLWEIVRDSFELGGLA